jgi:hypothetical protein
MLYEPLIGIIWLIIKPALIETAHRPAPIPHLRPLAIWSPGRTEAVEGPDPPERSLWNRNLALGKLTGVCFLRAPKVCHKLRWP